MKDFSNGSGLAKLKADIDCLFVDEDRNCGSDRKNGYKKNINWTPAYVSKNSILWDPAEKQQDRLRYTAFPECCQENQYQSDGGCDALVRTVRNSYSYDQRNHKNNSCYNHGDILNILFHEYILEQTSGRTPLIKGAWIVRHIQGLLFSFFKKIGSSLPAAGQA